MWMNWFIFIGNILFFGFLLTVFGFSIYYDNKPFMIIFLNLTILYSIQIGLFLLMLCFLGLYLSITFPF